jgi:hypothetical protein
VPAPAPAPTPTSVPAPTPAPLVPLVLVPPPATPVQPTPPSGAVTAPSVSQSPATARREERVRKHAQQSAYVIRPAGTASDDWFYGVIAAATLLAMLLGAQALRPRARPRPAWIATPPSARVRARRRARGP